MWNIVPKNLLENDFTYCLSDTFEGPFYVDFCCRKGIFYYLLKWKIKTYQRYYFLKMFIYHLSNIFNKSKDNGHATTTLTCLDTSTRFFFKKNVLNTLKLSLLSPEISYKSKQKLHFQGQTGLKFLCTICSYFP